MNEPNIRPVQTGSCGLCKFAVSQADGNMHCRRNPPQAIITPQGQLWAFPLTQAHYWCGEWKMGLATGSVSKLERAS